jgi:hypothetical protein
MAAPTTTTAMAKATTRKRFRLGRPVPSPWPDACEAVHCCKQKKHTLNQKMGFAYWLGANGQ